MLQNWDLRVNILTSEAVYMTQETKEIVKRLKECIEESNLTYVELEKKTGIAKSSIQRYASGATKKIPIDAIQSIAEALGVSPEYILGWESSKNFALPGEVESSIIGARIKELRILAKLSQQELANKCKFESSERVESIENGKYNLSNEELQLISSALDVNVDEIKTSWKKEPAVLTFVYAMEDRIEKGYTIPFEANSLLLKYYNDRESDGCNLDILTDPEVSLLASYRDLNENEKVRALEDIEDLSVTEDDIKVALFGGSGEVTDEMWQEVKNFAEFVKNKNKK